MAIRVRATEEVLAEHLAWSVEVAARGRSPLARLTSLLLLADLASVYAALELGHDPTPIGPIQHIKGALAAVPASSSPTP